MSMDAKVVQNDGRLRRSRHSFRWAWWYMPLISAPGGQANQSYVVRLCDFVCFVFVLKHGFHEFKLLQVSFVYAQFCLEL